MNLDKLDRHLVPGVGIEPTLLAERDFESVSASISGAACGPILSTKNAFSGSIVSLETPIFVEAVQRTGLSCVALVR